MPRFAPLPLPTPLLVGAGVVLVALASGCWSGEPADTGGDAPAFVPASPVLKRLTAAQYLNSVRDVFGPAVVVTEALEPDTEVNGLVAAGASVASLSAWGVEQYEAAARSIAAQALSDAATRAALVPCVGQSIVDDACATATLSPLGRRLWRRPLTDEELTRVVNVARGAAVDLGSFDEGLQYGIVALLQSPNFLYRVELGEPDPTHPGERRYTDFEMAGRLSYTLWNTTPDELLLGAAEAGELTELSTLSAQVDRMMADERHREGVRSFFTDVYSLDALDSLNKDPTVYLHMDGQVGPSAREQTLQDIEALVFDEQGDFRTLLTGTATHLDPKLSAIYDVAAPSLDGFAPTTLPADGGRRGLLGQVSVLALAAHPNSTSPTRRGLFVREVLLCQEIPLPPAGLNTAIPEPSSDGVTMRDRLQVHLTDPACASCHALTDYIGLGLENFDGLGGWRDTDGGEPIDASGTLDGVAFGDGWELAAAIASHPDLGPCLTRTFFQYAQGRAYDAELDADVVRWHAAQFEEGGFRVEQVIADVLTGPAFRAAGEVR